MRSLPALRLRKDLTRRLRAGSPWVYSDAVSGAESGKAGDLVDVRDRDGRFVARGYLDPASPIVARVLTLDEEEPLADVVARRLAEAVALRARVIDHATTTAYRLLNGEGDHLPGVVVDVYEKTAVVRFDGAGARAFARDGLVAALRARSDLALTHVFERSTRRESGMALFGPEPRGEIAVREHGMTLLVDVVRGQKTGTFLDQRENRLLIRSLAKGSRAMLNLFSYTGGFTLAAALGGSKETVSVDIAGAALETAKRTLEKNGVNTARHEMAKADAFDFLEKAGRGRFDIIVVDPPSMAPSKSALDRAIASYRTLNTGAIAAVAPGGLVASASCSSHVDEPAFLEMLAESAAAAARRVRIVTIRGAGPDHPVASGHPEGRYLKFVLLQVA